MVNPRKDKRRPGHVSVQKERREMNAFVGDVLRMRRADGSASERKMCQCLLLEEIEKGLRGWRRRRLRVSVGCHRLRTSTISTRTLNLAMLRFATASGFHEHEGASGLPTVGECPAMAMDFDENDEEQMREWLASLPEKCRKTYLNMGEPVNAETLSNCLKDFKKTMSRTMDLPSCACCGERRYSVQPEVDFPKVPLSSLTMLRVPADVVASRMELGEASMVYSMYESAGWDGSYYYLHPECVEWDHETDEYENKMKTNEKATQCKG